MIAAMTWTEYFASHMAMLLAALVLLAVAAALNAAETAFFNLTAGQLGHLAKGGTLGKLVARLMSHPRRLLNTILLANALTVTAYSALVAITLLDMEGMGLPAAAMAALALLPVLALILLAEIAPKSLALAASQRLACLLAPPLALLQKLFSPALWLMERVFINPLTRLLSSGGAEDTTINADELAALLDLSARRGVIAHEASELLREIVSLTGLRVGDVMVPRVDMIACDADAPPQKLRELFREARLRRIPVYEGDIDHIVGVVHAKRFLLNPDKPIRELVVKVPFVPEAANVERLLVQLRVTRQQMALVVDEYGGTAGLVTLEDVLEEIVGDIPDPNMGERPLVARVGQNQYLIDGELGVHEWADVFGTNLSAKRISTIGGFVTSLLGRIPKAGDTAAYRNLRFTVDSMRGRRIAKLRLELAKGHA